MERGLHPRGIANVRLHSHKTPLPNLNASLVASQRVSEKVMWCVSLAVWLDDGSLRFEGSALDEAGTAGRNSIAKNTVKYGIAMGLANLVFRKSKMVCRS